MRKRNTFQSHSLRGGASNIGHSRYRRILYLIYQSEIFPEIWTLFNHIINHLYQFSSLLPSIYVLKTSYFHGFIRLLELLGFVGLLGSIGLVELIESFMYKP
jgi:hypothetical protein